MKTKFHRKKKISPQSHNEDGNNHPKHGSVQILLYKPEYLEKGGIVSLGVTGTESHERYTGTQS